MGAGNFGIQLTPSKLRRFADQREGKKMVSDADIVRSLERVFQEADLYTISTGIIFKQLEKKFGENLTHRKAFIRQQVNLFVKAGGEPEQRQEDVKVANEAKESERKPTRKPRQTDLKADSKRFREKIDQRMEAITCKDQETKKRVRVGEGVERVVQASLPKKKGKSGGAAGGGFQKVCSLSPELQAIVGEPELSRFQVVKQLWAYIRENELQNPEDKREILCNDKLRALFGEDSTTIFKMNKQLCKHIMLLERRPEDYGESKAKKLKTEDAAFQRLKNVYDPRNVVVARLTLKKEKQAGGKVQWVAKKQNWHSMMLQKQRIDNL